MLMRRSQLRRTTRILFTASTFLALVVMMKCRLDAVRVLVGYQTPSSGTFKLNDGSPQKGKNILASTSSRENEDLAEKNEQPIQSKNTSL
jgi:hypothetical protein